MKPCASGPMLPPLDAAPGGVMFTIVANNVRPQGEEMTNVTEQLSQP